MAAVSPAIARAADLLPCVQEYARQIASRWNTKNGEVGYVTKFAVVAEFLDRYDVQIVGSNVHAEYWIPADGLDAFNEAIVGLIEVVRKFEASDD